MLGTGDVEGGQSQQDVGHQTETELIATVQRHLGGESDDSPCSKHFTFNTNSGSLSAILLTARASTSRALLSGSFRSAARLLDARLTNLSRRSWVNGMI